MNKLNLSLNYDIKTAKAIAKRVFDQYAKQNHANIEDQEVSPMIRDAYSSIGQNINPNQTDVKGFVTVLDKDGDGKVSLEDFERHCVDLFCGKSASSYLQNSQAPSSSGGRSFEFGQDRGYNESAKKSSYSGGNNYLVPPTTQSQYGSGSGGYLVPPRGNVSSDGDILEVIRRIFDQFDKDHNGFIDPSEVRGILEETYRIMGTKKVITDEDVKHYLNLLDTNHDGKISFEEFAAMFTRSIDRLGLKETLKKSGVHSRGGSGANSLHNSGYHSGRGSDHGGREFSSELPGRYGEGQKKSAFGSYGSIPSHNSSQYVDPNKYDPSKASLLDVIRRVFQKFDTDHNGYIDRNELRMLMEETYRGLGIPKRITEDDVNHYLKFADANHDGQLSLAELENIFVRGAQRVNGESVFTPTASNTLQNDMPFDSILSADKTNSPLRQRYDQHHEQPKRSGFYAPQPEGRQYEHESATRTLFPPQEKEKMLSASPGTTKRIHEVVKRIFNQFDENHNGYIEPTEIKHLIEATYEGIGVKKIITQDDVEHYLKVADTNHDGKISLEELEDLFVSSLKRHHMEDL